MKEPFYFNTTNHFENGRIVRYNGVVCANVVVGTNLFSDFAASFTDFFGGKSGTYKKKLELIYTAAMEDLMIKSKRLGANAVVGVTIDYDEISGKGKSMFMVSISGTACNVDIETENVEKDGMPLGMVSQDDLDKAILKTEIIEYVKRNGAVEEQWLDFMQENPIREILHELVSLFVAAYRINGYDERVKKMQALLKAYKREELIACLYHNIEESVDKPYLLWLISNFHLFDGGHILKICRENPKEGVKFLEIKSDYYEPKDLALMKEICAVYDSLPDTGKIEKTKSGVFSKKEKDMFICECGHVNSIENDFCTKCGVNIKGLSKKETDVVTEFRKRVYILSNMLK